MLFGAAFAGSEALAQKEHPMVTLSGIEGEIQFTGRLQNFRDGTYFLTVPPLGLIQIKAKLVNCIEGCEALAPAGPKFGIYGSRTVGTTLIPNLLRGYASYIGANYELVTTDDPAERIIMLTNSDGSIRAGFMWNRR